MKSQNKKQAQQQRSKELFTLSNQLFSAAKNFSEYHAAELKNNMTYALSYSKTAAHQDMAQLKALQSTVATEANKRMAVYQAKVKTILDQLGTKSNNKHLKDARTVLSTWYKDAKKKIPKGAEQLGQVAHEIADAGINAFKEGCKLVNEAAATAEKSIKKASKKKAIKAKKVTTKAKKVATKAKKASAKKQPVKKVTAKKVVAKKVVAKKARTKATPLGPKASTNSAESVSKEIANQSPTTGPANT